METIFNHLLPKLYSTEPAANKEKIFQATYPNQLNKAPLNLPNKIKKKFYHSLLIIFNVATGGIETVILPALKIYKHNQFYRRLKEKICANPSQGCSPISFKTADGCVIDGVIIWKDLNDFLQFRIHSQLKNNLFKQSRWVMIFNGNAECYEQKIEWAREYSKKSDSNLLLFNYRGVSDSQGYPSSTEDFILDGDAAFQYLQDKGVSSEAIAIHGYSLGGAVGTHVRALHGNGPLANERSFSSIGKLIEGFIFSLLAKPKPHTFQRTIIQAFAWSIGKAVGNLLKETNWELNSLEKWPTITGYKWIITASDDVLMQGIGRLYNALNKNALHIKSKGTTHTMSLSTEALKAHFTHLQNSFAPR